MANNPNATANLKPFKKGDSRINRKGKPKDFEALRREAIKVAGEILTSPDGALAASRVHMILNDWASSKDVRKQQLFLAYAFGNVPTETQLSGKGGGDIKSLVEVVYVNRENRANQIAPPSTDNQEPGSSV